jgi:hypothetical protein
MAKYLAECELTDTDNEHLSILYKFYQEAIKYSIKEVNTLQDKLKSTHTPPFTDLKEELEVKEKALVEFNEFVRDKCGDIEDESGEFKVTYIEDYKRIKESNITKFEPSIDNNLGAEIRMVKTLLNEAEDSVNRLQRATEESELEGIQKERTCIIMMSKSEVQEPAIEESSVSESKVLVPEEKLRVLVVYQPKIRSEDVVVQEKPDVEVKDISIQTLYFMYPSNCFTIDYLRRMVHEEGKVCLIKK